jgi:hypothetical protein
MGRYTVSTRLVSGPFLRCIVVGCNPRDNYPVCTPYTPCSAYRVQRGAFLWLHPQFNDGPRCDPPQT